MQSATLLDSLPPFLKQRTRVVSDAADAAGDIVVYWMVTAARADENPALDAARVAAATTAASCAFGDASMVADAGRSPDLFARAFDMRAIARCAARCR